MSETKGKNTLVFALGGYFQSERFRGANTVLGAGSKLDHLIGYKSKLDPRHFCHVMYSQPNSIKNLKKKPLLATLEGCLHY